MRNLFLLLAFLNFTFLGIGQNMLTNGDMEQWSSGIPNGWTTIDDGITVSQASMPLHGGNASAKIELTTKAQANTDFHQMIDVVAGTEYAVSVWVYHTDNKAKARLNIGGYHNYSDNDLLDQWQELTYTYIATENKSIKVGLRFYDQTGFETSSIMYIDDFVMMANVSGENQPPIIAEITQNPTLVGENDEVMVMATVTDDNAVENVVLKWGLESGSLNNEVIMNPIGDYIYTGMIPGQSVNTTVYYAITATDDNNSSTTSSEMNYTVSELTTPTAGLIISQYYEGTSNNKWIEITNLSTEEIDLSNYYLTIWSNTDTPSGAGNNGNVINGTIAAGQTILIRNSGTDTPGYAMSNTTTIVNSGTGFNGNDVVAITFGNKEWNNRVDCIYGSGDWGKNTSFYRKGIVNQGNTEMSVLDGSGEWIEVAIDDVNNAIDTESAYLGVHLLGETPNQLPVITNITHNPTSITENDEVEVMAMVTDDSAVENVVLKWGLESGNLNNEVVMNPIGDYIYIGTIPAQSGNTTVYYTITATDDNNSSTTSVETSYEVLEVIVNQPPVITDITHNPTSVTENDDVEVMATITDDNAVESVVLKWGLESGNLNNEVVMNPIGDYIYTGMIPEQNANTTVYYVITATDDNNSSTTSLEMNYMVSEAPTPTDGLIISQYYEGTSNNKWIEITNLSEEDIDLSNYYLTIWSNTDMPSGVGNNGNVINGTIAAGQTILIRNSGTDTPGYAMSNTTTVVNSGTGFNGNDVVAITFGNKEWNNRVDCIYGSGDWGKNTSFYRKGTVNQGNTEMSVLDGSGEWIEVAIDDVNNAMDTESAYLGVHLLGEELMPEIAVNPENHDFGTVEVGENLTKTFTIMNTGTAPLIISAITLSGNDAFTTNGMPTTIAVEDSYVFDVVFEPAAVGMVSATVTIENNSETPTVMVSVMGIGEEAVVPVPEYAVWQGQESDDWFTAANWDVNAVPGEITAVTIPANAEQYPTISEEAMEIGGIDGAVCKNITFEQGATLLGFEMLMVVENATFHQFLTGGENAPEKDSPNAIYHHVSSPVANPNAGDIFPLSAYLRQYNETTQMWENLLAADGMEVGKGYNLWMPEGDENITYQGALNQEAIGFNGLTLTGAVNNYSGWHLLGNPYPAAIDVNALTFPAEMQHSVSVWSNENGTYLTSNGTAGSLTDNALPVAQGFFVKVNENNVNFTISPEACVHNSTSAYKGDSKLIAINVKNNANQYNETAFVTFSEDGNNGYDVFDVVKLDGLNAAPALYTMIDDMRININSRYSADKMPLYFNTNVDGSFTLKVTDLNLRGEATIEDTFTGAMIPATADATYEFTANADDDMARFVVHFKGFTNVEDKDLNINVYADRQQVVVNNQTSEEAVIMLYNMAGQLIEAVRTMDVETRINVEVKGAYFVTVKNSKAVQTEKVIIK